MQPLLYIVDVFLILCVAYLYFLVIGSVIKPKGKESPSCQEIHFAIAIPAHNEESVISSTIRTLQELDYPKDKYEIFVVADHCTDNTAELAREFGAKVIERTEQPSGSKGAALKYLFKEILGNNQPIDAVIVFDADTRVDPQFLNFMSIRIMNGDQAIQGNHVISNPKDGWFPLLTWAMFIIDNRYQNLGRSNLGFSAKNMGDSICFSSEIIRSYGWGEGLTEDYAFRRILLLNHVRIAYEPRAKAYGQAPVSLKVANHQRLRWIKGVQQSNQGNKWGLLREGVIKKNPIIIEGGLHAIIPSYSTITVITVFVLLLSVLFYSLRMVDVGIVGINVCLFITLLSYPFWGLIFEKAPIEAYMAILMGPFYVIWRTWLSVKARMTKNIFWIRTQRH